MPINIALLYRRAKSLPMGVKDNSSAKSPVPIPVCSAIFQCGKLTKFANVGAVMQNMHAQVGCVSR